MSEKFLKVIVGFMLMVVLPVTFAQGRSHTDPAGIGVAVKSIIQVGSVNTGNYDVTITVLETVRGGPALEQLEPNNGNNLSPGPGHEFLLARIRFELQGRVVSDKGLFELGSSPFQWVAYSSSFSQYGSPSAMPPEPALKGNAGSGEIKEGWLVFEVEETEDKPVMMFDPSTGGASGRGKTLFFNLY